MVHTRKSDAEVVEGMVAGDGAALDEFYRRYSGRVMAILLKALGNRAESEERLQEVFVELWRRAPQYDPARGTVVAWVCRISRCRAIDAMRARKRRHIDSQIPDEDAVLVAPGQFCPRAMAEERRRRDRVRSALAGLSPAHRETLEHAYFGGLSHSEISARMGVPLGTVKSRISAAMRRLREALELAQAEAGEPKLSAVA